VRPCLIPERFALGLQALAPSVSAAETCRKTFQRVPGAGSFLPESFIQHANCWICTFGALVAQGLSPTPVLIVLGVTQQGESGGVLAGEARQYTPINLPTA